MNNDYSHLSSRTQRFMKLHEEAKPTKPFGKDEITEDYLRDNALLLFSTARLKEMTHTKDTINVYTFIGIDTEYTIATDPNEELTLPIDAKGILDACEEIATEVISNVRQRLSDEELDELADKLSIEHIQPCNCTQTHIHENYCDFDQNSYVDAIALEYAKIEIENNAKEVWLTN